MRMMIMTVSPMAMALHVMLVVLLTDSCVPFVTRMFTSVLLLTIAGLTFVF
jgi:hypothetical protein